MLRRLIHNKAGQIPQLKSISKSLFGYNKAFFSNSQLDDGEYIDGDFSFAPSAAETRQRQSEIEKKFVTFDNFGKNLTRQAPKPGNNYKTEITGSVSRIKSKFNFELAEEDEFARELTQRQQKKAQKKAKGRVSTGKFASEEESKKIISAFQSHGRAAIEDLEKNLTKIPALDRTTENGKNHPTQKKIAEIIDKLAESQEQSSQALQEYNLGEEGVDFIHPAEDPAKAFENMQGEIINELADYKLLGPQKRGTVDQINEWRVSKEVESRNLVLEDEEPIPYPGSSKGRHPLDDPEFFVEWFHNKVPKSHMRFYEKVYERMSDSRKTIGGTKPVVSGVEHFIQSPVPFTEMGLTAPEDAIAEERNSLVFRSYLDLQRGEIDLLPDQIDQDYQQIQEDLEKWSLFRLYPILNNWFKVFDHQMKNINSPPLMGEKVTPLPTLMRYYSLLPEFARNNQIVMDVVRAFEFTKHDLTLREKEIAVNFACQFALPMEYDLEESMKQAVLSNHKYFVPLWEEITLLDDSRDQESKEANLLGEKKKKATPIKLLEDVAEAQKAGVPEDLRNIGEWQAPPRLDPYVSEEDPFPILPIDYYDNEDGFWDDYIAKKEATYDEIPMIVTRPYFKH